MSETKATVETTSSAEWMLATCPDLSQCQQVSWRLECCRELPAPESSPGWKMLVQVHWTNNSYDYVQDFMLDTLIEAGVVARFLRSSGWVTIGVDPIRKRRHNDDYKGVERRSLNIVSEAQ